MKRITPLLLVLVLLTACGTKPETVMEVLEVPAFSLPETADAEPVSAPAVVTEGRAPAEDYEATLRWLRENGEPLREFICDTGLYLEDALSAGKSVLFEAQLGALRDIDYGIYPYTSSSTTLAAYAPIGAGIPGRKLDKTVGVMKAYSSCVGEGPFTCELFGEEAEALREAGGEYGAATGRPRRVGPRRGAERRGEERRGEERR